MNKKILFSIFIAISCMNAKGQTTYTADEYKGTQNKWSLKTNGENLQFYEPEANKEWAVFQDNVGLRLTGAPNLWVGGNLYMKANKRAYFGYEDNESGYLAIFNALGCYNSYMDFKGNLYFRPVGNEGNTISFQSDGSVIIGSDYECSNTVRNTNGNKLFVNGGIEGTSLTAPHISTSLLNTESITSTGTITINDFTSAGGKNLVIGDDTYFTDIDRGSFLGLYGMYYNDRAGLQLGSNSNSYIFGLNGNIGVGTENPQYKLDVNGTIRATSIELTNGANFSGNIITNNLVRIGCTDVSDASVKLAVEGHIMATEITIQSSVCSDYIFDKDYALRPLEEVEEYVSINKHLPEIPSMEEFRENGQNLGQMDDLLLRKVEELTLYIIAQDKKIKELEQKIKN